MTKETKKTMIVVWRWDFLPDHLNAQLYKKKFGDRQPNLEEGQGQYYDVYQVAPSRLCPDAELVAIRIYKDGAGTESLLERLMERYLPTEDKSGEHQTMLFLHRGNDFDERDVAHFLYQYSSRLYKAFLIAQGRDYIYSNTEKGHIGLLSHIGDFAWGTHPGTGEKYFVADDDLKIINQPYFDRVWLYYDIEFETKVFELKEDLFDTLYPLLLPNQPEEIPRHDVINRIRKRDNGLLWYRMKSFMDVYEQKVKDLYNMDTFVETEQEMVRLKAAEKEDAKSYFFDDCVANLEREQLNDRVFLAQEYEAVRDRMKAIFMGGENRMTSKTELRDLANKLNYLVKIIPGVMD